MDLQRPRKHSEDTQSQDIRVATGLHVASQQDAPLKKKRKRKVISGSLVVKTAPFADGPLNIAKKVFNLQAGGIITGEIKTCRIKLFNATVV